MDTEAPSNVSGPERLMFPPGRTWRYVFGVGDSLATPSAPRTLRVGFDAPEHGWMALELRSNDDRLLAVFSHTYPTLPDLCAGLCEAWVGQPARRVTKGSGRADTED